jgi:hypothetical protein
MSIVGWFVQVERELGSFFFSLSLFSMQHWNSPSIRQLALLGGGPGLDGRKKIGRRKYQVYGVLFSQGSISSVSTYISSPSGLCVFLF